MPTLNQATKPPANLSDLSLVTQTPAAQLPMPHPDPNSMPNYDALSLAPAPAIMSTEIDRQRQFYRPGVSQYRISPLPTKANPQLNAAASSVSKTVISQIVTPPTIDNDEIIVNPQTGTSYTVQQSDFNKLISIGNASAGTIFLPPVAGTVGVSVNNKNASLFNAGNTSTVGLVTTSTATVTVADTPINAGDFLFLFIRLITGVGGSATATLSDTANGSWSLINHVNESDGAFGNDDILLFAVQAPTKIAVGGTFTATFVATYSVSAFNPADNEFWNMTGLKKLDGSVSNTGIVGGNAFSSGGLTTASFDTIISCAETDNGVLTSGIPAGPWTNIFASLTIGVNYRTGVFGFVNDVYSTSGNGRAFGDLLVSYVETQASDVANLSGDFFCYIQNTGAGTITVKSFINIDGSSSSVSLSTGQGALFVYSPELNGWFTERGMGGGGGGGVTSVFGRTGAVVAQTGDYTAAQVTSAESTANKDAVSGYAGLTSATMLKLAEQASAVDARITTSEAVSDSDRAKLVTFSNTSAVAATIAQAGASSLFLAGWYCDLVNINTGTVTLTPATSTINNQSTLVLERYEGGRLVSDGTNYWFIAGQPTLDTPNDADILTFETATKRWRSKSIGAIGGANASQLRGINISSAAPANQQILKWISADNQYDLVLADGMEHGDNVWWSDAAFNEYREDFNTCINTSKFSGSAPVNEIGRLGWSADWQAGSNPLFTFGGIAPYLGSYSWENNASANQLCPLMWPNFQGTSATNQGAQALLDNPGWEASFVFRVTPCGVSTSSNIGFFSGQRKSIYVGLSGATVGAFASSSPVSSRPDVFIGLRYDTSSANGNAQIVTSIGNASAGSTVYTGTFNSGTTNALAGINFTIRGAANAVNNGTFACTASTTTTLTLSNAAGVAETITSSVAPYQVSAYPASQILTAAAAHVGGSTTYTMMNMGNFSSGANNAYAGVTFVVAGFVNGANNGTFACTASTATTLVLSNGAGIAETHAGTAAVSGSTGIVGDTVYTFEATFNQQYSTLVRHYAVGQQATTTLAPANDGWHRLDISCTASGVVTLTLDGSGTNTVTFTLSQMTHSTTGNSQVTNKLGLVSYTTGTSGTTGTPPVTPGTAVTLSGYTGGFTSLNGGTFNVAWAHNGLATFTYIATGISDIANASQTPTLTFWPGLLPIFGMGNDEFGNNGTTPAPVSNYMRFWADAFLLSWNKAIASPATIPDKTKPRYW